MSGGAEMIAGAVVQRVAGMLGQAAWERVELLRRFSDDVEEMKGNLATVQAVMVDAENRSQDSELVRLWLKKLKSAAYNIEDTIDELEANTMIWRSSTCSVKLVLMSFNPLITRFTLSIKMRKIREELDKIAEERRKFNFLQLADTRPALNINNQETSVGSGDKIELVGRQSEKSRILNLVLQNDGQAKVSIIPIVGLGGMGKTTLIKSVFIGKETNMFDVKAWVHVSKDFDVKKIVSAVISQVEGSFPANDTRLQNLNSGLERVLSGKIYLIDLDDLWEERGDRLEHLMELLQYGNEGSKIIVTTRSDQVAAALCRIRYSQFHTVPQIALEALSSDDCWSIMNPPSIGNEKDVELVKTGKEIAKKCGGLPLVAKALGYVMNKHCTREAWLKIRDSNILEIKENDYGILSGLMLSYNHMPSLLKLCFMYCSIFPKSHNIYHDSLIQQWVALGFIQDARGTSLQQIGEECINDFLGMSFLTLSTIPEVIDSGTFKPTLKYHMHDVVHDLARYVASEEFSYVNKTAHNNIRDHRNCHYQLLMDHNESSAFMSLPTKVRAIHFRECNKLRLPKQAFSHTLYLRVLDLSGCRVSELPGSLCKLKLLRYLDASNLPISNLPKSLNRLLNLQTLILSNSSLEILPSNIGCLQKLQYFDLSGCVNLCELPISFGNLSALLFLNLANCHDLHTLPESFGKLHRLQFLNLSDCYKLQSLHEVCCQLPDLTHLDLSDCHNLEKLPDCIDKLSKLEYLNMTSCSKVQMLPESLCKLMMLKHLNLSFCVKLEHLPSSFGDLRLQHLDLEGCCFLVDLPDSIFNMSTLVHVQITFLSYYINSKVENLRKKLNLKGLYKVDVGSSDLWSQIAELEKVSCHELTIMGLENVRNLEGAEQTKLWNNSNLKWLVLVWERDKSSLVEHADALADKSVLEKLVPPRSLQFLGLGRYMSIDFPRWMLDIPSCLPHLTTIFLVDLEGCSHLPPLGRLPNLRALVLKEMPNIKSVGSEFYGDYGSCLKLRILALISMDNLEERWTTRSSDEDGEFLIPNLHLLSATNCPKLKFLPYPPKSVIWVLENSDHVLPEHGFRNLSSTTTPFCLEFVGPSPSCEVWRRAHRYLSSVEILSLTTMTGLRTLTEITRGFPSLRKLEIEKCDDLETLSEFGDLVFLREILIKECPKVSSLPESIQRLTELKKLSIIDCPTLSEKSKGEDRHKIAHIPEVKFE